MDDANLILPCGFSVTHQDLLNKSSKFECPVCKTHELTIDECLNMTRNKLVLNKKLFESKQKEFRECAKKLENYKTNLKCFIDLNHDDFKNEIDLRREEIKVMINKKIEDYYDGLLKKIEIERDLKSIELNNKIKVFDTKKKDIDSIEIDKSSDVHSKLDNYKEKRKIIENGINFATSIENELCGTKFRLSDISENFFIEKIFGELYLKEETTFFIDNEIDRPEVSILLKINDFSKIKDSKDLNIYSKDGFFKNFLWFFEVRFEQDLNKTKNISMSLFLFCKSIDQFSKYPINVKVQFSLLDKTSQCKNFTRCFQKLYDDYYNPGYGFPSFIGINEIMNEKNNYYSPKDDSITIKATINKIQ